ncbi:MAG: tRNA uridine(34) 5-carboxymethylaminomethyl modification radical SAM/GNAT enzyme Elp3 [Nitrososphaerota archaeon]|nr:tRNA uridine(34) 5-carboxymethylaminomethyl modification radical SAM/GNAT enzyme Elp3 [Aigarchaeota archaeon]MDW8076954.1 tRNA uridine(34) 5-carboxymethylaminomethyl modification radical SAM/GNAT enzyme Elp3 [Nitrososphaerota archaeon]
MIPKETSMKEFVKALMDKYREGVSVNVSRLKMSIAKELNLSYVPSNLEILSMVTEENERKLLARILRVKPVRTASGVSVVTVVTPPSRCPHGRCIYCPGGIEYSTPQSYTGEEAAIKLAAISSYDPYLQVKKKIETLHSMGHDVDKIEIIIIGGTFTAFPIDFQRYFLKRCVEAAIGLDAMTLEEVLARAESSSRRISGITVETRPDCVSLEQANALLEMGVTRVELGVQALDDEIYRICKRNHAVVDVINSTRLLKDLAFKVCYHIMPNLPGSSYEKDLKMFKEIFENPDFRPDMLKIYPTLVLPGTELYEIWREGKYRSYDDEELVALLCEWFSMVPPYVRVIRVQREIPLQLAAAGNRLYNLREIVEKRLKDMGRPCRCIRCREVGHKVLKEGIYPDMNSVELRTIKYEASNGLEYFLSYEDVKNDILLGFVRLRIPSEALRSELEGAALVRELHVYGQMTPVGDEPSDRSWQHKGFGSKLLSEVERISAEEGCRKVVVISGVGVREYYYKHGYVKEGPYVTKKLR